MPNPFFVGGRIEDAQYFVGREAALQRIFSALEMAHSGQTQHTAVFGPRRIGKSSLLYHATRPGVNTARLSQPGAYRFVYIDLDDAHCHTRPGLLHYILEQLGLPAPAQPTLERFQEALERLVQRQGCRAVLCLDEFEHLAARPSEFDGNFFAAWRSLGGNNLAAFLTASKRPLDEVLPKEGLTSGFHNIFLALPLGELPEGEALRLVERGRASDRPFDDAECQHLLRLAGRHPYRLQLAGSLLYQAKGGPAPVNWRTVEGDFRKQAAFVFGQPPSSWAARRAWLGRALRGLLSSPRLLGRAALDLLKYDKAADSTAWLVGAGLIVVGLLLLAGILDYTSLQETFGRTWRFFFPTK